ncbi:MAG: hypothetical protein GY719_21765, partial [bacterium]|nr:hypothetical protein [bacterium]
MPRPTGMTFLGLAVVLLVAAILPAAAGAVTLEELLAMTPEERKAAKADLTAA